LNCRWNIQWDFIFQDNLHTLQHEKKILLLSSCSIPITALQNVIAKKSSWRALHMLPLPLKWGNFFSFILKYFLHYTQISLWCLNCIEGAEVRATKHYSATHLQNSFCSDLPSSMRNFKAY
jgi:hypothetical protein